MLQQSKQLRSKMLTKDERDQIMAQYEEELKDLELKFDKILCENHNKRNNTVVSNPKLNSYWLGVLSNHKIIKDFISDDDVDALKYLRSVSYKKLEDGNVKFSLI